MEILHINLTEILVCTPWLFFSLVKVVNKCGTKSKKFRMIKGLNACARGYKRLKLHPTLIYSCHFFGCLLARSSRQEAAAEGKIDIRACIVNVCVLGEVMF